MLRAPGGIRTLVVEDGGYQMRCWRSAAREFKERVVIEAREFNCLGVQLCLDVGLLCWLCFFENQVPGRVWS